MTAIYDFAQSSLSEIIIAMDYFVPNVSHIKLQWAQYYREIECK